MRFKISIDLNTTNIPIDKNRMILSFLKHYLERSNKEFYEKMYKKGNVDRKKSTFSLYLKDAKFENDFINIPDKTIILYFSTSDMIFGIEFYNAMVEGKSHPYLYKNIELTIKQIQMIKERNIIDNEVVFKTMSPLVIRDHEDNSNTWYYDICDQKGKEIFIRNLKNQILEELPESKYDVDNIDVRIISSKKTVIKYYGIWIQSNLCILDIKAKPYILNHLHKSGIGSLKSAGFGMLNLM